MGVLVGGVLHFLDMPQQQFPLAQQRLQRLPDQPKSCGGVLRARMRLPDGLDLLLHPVQGSIELPERARGLVVIDPAVIGEGGEVRAFVRHIEKTHSPH